MQHCALQSCLVPADKRHPWTRRRGVNIGFTTGMPGGIAGNSSTGAPILKYRKLGHAGPEVSLIGLGTMTWGEQNTESDAHEQLDYALSRGVNLVDAAEMYPVPHKPETQGRTETYIGTWLAKTGRRKDIVLTSKVSGPATDPKRPSHIRTGQTHLDRKNMTEALDASLKRLQTDYLDLYQLHWPDRTATTFGRPACPW